MDLQPKIVLGEKQKTTLPSDWAGKVGLNWTEGVDLDAMAFVKMTDGSEMAVFSDAIKPGFMSHGWISLDGDAGIGGKAGDNRETITITGIPDDVETVDVVVMNWTKAAVDKEEVAFADYDAMGHILPDDPNADDYGIPLVSEERGNVCHICTLKRTENGVELISQNVTYSVADAAAEFPGFSNLSK